MFIIDRSAISIYSLRNCEGKLAVQLPAPIFLKTVNAVVVRCCGTAYLPNCGEHKLFLILNPAAAVSYFMIKKLINHTAFMESRHFVVLIFVFIFIVIRFNQQ